MLKQIFSIGFIAAATAVFAQPNVPPPPAPHPPVKPPHNQTVQIQTQAKQFRERAAQLRVQAAKLEAEAAKLESQAAQLEAQIAASAHHGPHINTPPPPPPPQVVNTQITPQEARRIALTAAGVAEKDVRKVKVEFERKYKIPVYEVEFDTRFHEYEYKIDARNGAIIKNKKELDLL